MTGRPCTICNHPERDQIDRAIVNGDNFTVLSSNFGLTRQALIRHREKHIPHPAANAAAVAIAEAETLRGATLADTASNLLGKALDLLHQAEQAGELRTALAGVREAGRCLELVAKLRGELSEGVTVNLIAAPQFLMVQSVILAALAPYPEARLAVAAALEGVR